MAFRVDNYKPLCRKLNKQGSVFDYKITTPLQDNWKLIQKHWRNGNF